MRTSAIIRIILFSVAIFLLLGILGLGLGITTFMCRFSGEQTHTSGEVTHVPEKVDSTNSPENSAAGIIPQDTTVSTESLQAVSGTYTYDAARIREIEIDWAAGSITIQPVADLTEIQITETEPSDDKYRMVCKQSGDTLSIQYCKSSIQFPSFGITADSAKDLVILVPADWICRSLEIDAASADVMLQDLTVEELDFDGASGCCDLINCNVGSMDLDAASGNIRFSGCLDSLDFDGASGDCTLVLTNCPRYVDLDGVSGRLDITLPSDCGFSVDTDGLRCDFTTDFTTETRNGRYHCGNGSCSIDIDAISGSVRIHDGGYASHSADADCPGSCAVHSGHH